MSQRSTLYYGSKLWLKRIDLIQVTNLEKIRQTQQISQDSSSTPSPSAEQAPVMTSES